MRAVHGVRPCARGQRIRRRSLGGLAPEEPELQAFAADFLAAEAMSPARRLLAGAYGHPWAPQALRRLWPAAIAARGEEFERLVVTRFLMSSDAFAEPGRLPERLSYLGYADPFEPGCHNALFQPLEAA